jgi:hypothetical protein
MKPWCRSGDKPVSIMMIEALQRCTMRSKFGVWPCNPALSAVEGTSGRTDADDPPHPQLLPQIRRPPTDHFLILHLRQSPPPERSAFCIQFGLFLVRAFR